MRKPLCGKLNAVTRHYSGGDTCLGLSDQAGLTGQVVLTRPTPRTLAGYDRTTLEDLTAPDAPGLFTLKSTGQALDPKRAVAAE
jgi:hypothetical protein